MSSEKHIPVWSRDEAFPQKPSSAEFGFFDTKETSHPCATADELADKVAKSRNGIGLAWHPKNDHLVAPEEVVEIRPKLWQRRSKWAENDLADGKRMSLVFAIAMVWYFYASYRNHGTFNDALQSPGVGIAGILLLIFGLVPLYEGWKTLSKGKPQTDKDWQSEVEESRFDSWLDLQKAPITYTVLAIMLIAGLSQLLITRSLEWSDQSLFKGALLKNQSSPEWWRYLTAPLLHGNLLHWFMNAAALRYLARRVEVLARWPHVVIVLIWSAFLGGIFTTYLSEKASVGASGGIMGLLGFLLVFEMMHSRLVPKPTRRRLLAGVLITIFMGILGFSFIDNAAHAGGLLAGMLYAVIGFPPSKSPHRPAILKQDKTIAIAGFALMIVGLILVIVKIHG